MQLDLESRGVPRAKMTVVPMGVDLAEFEPARARPNTSTATLGYLGKVGPERRLGVLIDVLHRLRTGYGVNAELLIVGDGDHPGDLAIVMRRAAELGAQDFVRVTGYLPRAAAIAAIKTADVCISPYYPTPVLLSTSPTKLIEYMALALPVVGNEHPEQSLIIGQSGAGRCVPWGVEPFAAAVADILSLSPEDRAALGRRGRAWVESHRTYRKIADDVEKQYLALRESTVSSAID
jgi:glycosyltransferase involved in cell wall biosynthesis